MNVNDQVLLNYIKDQHNDDAIKLIESNTNYVTVKALTTCIKHNNIAVFGKCLEVVTFTDVGMQNLLDHIIRHGKTVKQRQYIVQFIESLYDHYTNLIKKIINVPYNGTFFLELAVSYINVGTIKLLISYGADVNMLNKDGNSLLHMTMRKECHMYIIPFKQVATILINSGFNLNIRNRDGMTVIDHARSLNLNDHANFLEGYVSALNIKEPDI